MHQTIYFNQKALVLCDAESEAVQKIRQQPGSLLLRSASPDTVQQALERIQQGGTPAVVLLHPSVDELMAQVQQKTEVIRAGGGLVYNDRQQVLLIFRRGKWDLPKGKLDEGETMEACALREVREETGLDGLEMGKRLLVSYHTYYQEGRLILKESHWYLMKCLQEQVLTPQLDEDIEKCEWVAASRLAPYMENSHPSIIDVLQAGLQELGFQKSLS